jgi:enoyl-CoA hydratase/carnithine racemase
MAELSVERRGRVAVLTLCRPQHGNRLTAPLAREVVAALAAARDDSNVGACVLTGAGGVFCLGGDWRGAGASHVARDDYAHALIEMDSAMARLGKPLIAAVNGDAHAGGLATALACDLAIVADDATLGLPEAASGLFPFIALAIVKDVLPKGALFDLIYRARLMSAAEACAMRIVSEAVPRAAVVGRAIEIAEQAATHRPEIVALGRDLYYRLRGVPPAQALDDARQALLAALAVTDRN